MAPALLDAGVPALRLVNRTVARAAQLAAELKGLGPIASAGWDNLEHALADAALLVNCTSLGMTGQPPLEIELAPLSPGAVVADLVYAPLETQLLSAARRRGNPAVEGLGMLLHQAVPGFAHWGGVVAEVDEALRAVVLADRDPG